MATVGLRPAGELALVNGVLSPCARHIIHPNQASAFKIDRQEEEEEKEGYYLFYIGEICMERHHIQCKD